LPGIKCSPSGSLSGLFGKLVFLESIVGFSLPLADAGDKPLDLDTRIIKLVDTGWQRSGIKLKRSNRNTFPLLASHFI
ncbi:hypothetical protein CUMW_222490, partial [Citrus unshiu]